jgi:hypothetical protein
MVIFSSLDSGNSSLKIFSCLMEIIMYSSVSRDEQRIDLQIGRQFFQN